MAENHLGNLLFITGESSSSDTELVFTTSDVSQYRSFVLMSTAGAMDVEVTLDGTNWITAPLSLIDYGATTTDPVIVTVAGRLYGFPGQFKQVRCRQNGVTAVANAAMTCAT